VQVPVAVDAAHPPLLDRREGRRGGEQAESLVEAVGCLRRRRPHPDLERGGVERVRDGREQGEEPGEVASGRRRLAPLAADGRGSGAGQAVPGRDVGDHPHAVVAHPQR
jgi:hypothetical protein